MRRIIDYGWSISYGLRPYRGKAFFYYVQFLRNDSITGDTVVKNYRISGQEFAINGCHAKFGSSCIPSEFHWMEFHWKMEWLLITQVGVTFSRFLFTWSEFFQSVSWNKFFYFVSWSELNIFFHSVKWNEYFHL